jgi:16S rRNA G527 N7-methylase RsmG
MVQDLDPEKGEQIAIKIQMKTWKALLHTWNERCNIQHQQTNENMQVTHQHFHTQVLAMYTSKSKALTSLTNKL